VIGEMLEWLRDFIDWMAYSTLAKLVLGGLIVVPIVLIDRALRKRHGRSEPGRFNNR
jgi:hypothetical protein